MNPNEIPNYHLISRFFQKRLSEQEYYIASIVQKCLKPGRIYKITDHQMNEIIDKMLGYTKADSLKRISYDVFVLALYISSKTSTILLYNGAKYALEKIRAAVFVEWCPMVGFIFMMIRLGFKINLTQGGVAAATQVIFGFLKAIGTYSGLHRFRSLFLIDCTYYVTELDQVSKQELPYVQALPESDSSSNMCYTRERPNLHQAYVSTSRDVGLYYQKDIQNDIQIKTLDGTIKQTRKVNGERSLNWVKNRESKNLNSNKYIPLEARTKTLDDLRDLDTTAVREAAGRITEHIQKKQQVACLIEESLEDEIDNS